MHSFPPIRAINLRLGCHGPPRPPSLGREAPCSSNEGTLQRALLRLQPPGPVPAGATPFGRWEACRCSHSAEASPTP